MNTARCCLLLALGSSGVADRAEAAPVKDPWFVHLGAARLDTDEAAAIRVFDMPQQGADVRLTPSYTAAVEIGRFLTPTIAVGVSAGLPLKQTIFAAGTIRPYGALGRITNGPAAATVHWHPLPTGLMRPYVGAGVSYLHVFASKDAAMRDLHVSDKAGPVVQGGIDVPLRHGFGMFVDVKKGWLRTRASGSLAGAPVTASIRLDPLILHTGISARF